MEETKIAGEYYLQGAREMASGFLLQPGGEFRFFFSYGALDRQGSGKWVVANNRQLVLTSAPKPLSDFTLVESSTTGDDFVTVKIQDGNPTLLRHIFCSLQKGVEGTWLQMNHEHEVQFPKQETGSVSLLLGFCPERFSAIPVPSANHNHFSFRIEPSVMEVFFENFSLQVGENELAGKHPLMEGDQFIYAKP